MKKKFVFIVVASILLLCLIAFLSVTKQPLASLLRLPGQTSNILTTLPDLDHVVLITMENKSYPDIVGSTHAPYINSLISTYSFADNYLAVAHPSLPNYLALIGGSTFDVTSDCDNCFVSGSSLVTQLENAHRTWKAYMESMPNSCFVGNDGTYAQKHNPFIYFDEIRNNPQQCGNIVPYQELQKDLSSKDTTPNFIWISPNLCNDMHDCSVRTGDTWLAENIPTILSSPAFTKQKSLLIITWDEGEKSSNNRVPTLFISNSVKKHFITHASYSHYSLLHTIESMWGLPPLTVSTAQSPLITDIFK